jgi:hypothetical protein
MDHVDTANHPARPLNLTNQAYFNLSGRSDATVLDDELTTAAGRF